MSPELRSKIANLVSEFAESLVSMLANQPISAFAGGLPAQATRVQSAPKTAKPLTRTGRLPKRGPEEMDAVIDSVVQVLSSNPRGLTSERLQAALNIDKKEITRPLLLGLEKGVLRKEGEKRATTYFCVQGADFGTVDFGSVTDVAVEAPLDLTLDATLDAPEEEVIHYDHSPKEEEEESLELEGKVVEAVEEPSRKKRNKKKGNHAAVA